MSEPLLIPEACTRTLTAVEANSLDPGAEAEGHLQICRACAESRVAYLAQEEVPLALTPAGYFERLPGRILGKLPASPRRHSPVRFYWGAAAALLLAVGATAFWVGRANRSPLVEASLPQPLVEIQEVSSETPFQDHEDAVSQLSNLSQEDADAVIRALSSQRSAPVE